MNVKRLSIAIVTAFITSLLVSCNQKTEINNISPERIQALTAKAYIFSYPLIMNYATMYKQAINPNAPEYVGGFGKFRHYGFATSDNKDIVTPNNNTPYSWAWMDLRSEPWVLIMPPVDSRRYYASQWDDLWAYVLDSPGSLIDGDRGGTYLIAPADWKGTVPEGVKRVIRGESYFLGTLTRTGADGPEDLAKVQAIQAGYKLMPLHEYLNEPAPKAPKSIDWLPFDTGNERAIDVFKYVNLVLPFTIPNELDKPALDSMAVLGIAPGLAWDTAKFSDATKEAIRAGIMDALKEITEYKSKITSGGQLFNAREVLKTDYMARAVGVFIGIFGNYASQVAYMSWHKDTDGDQINTANASYKLTFKKGEVPPARCFWSITVYNLPERFLVPNPLNRYSIGNRSPQLKTNADGNIDLYISKTSPGKALESNWLPAPDGEPFIIMRIYGPGEAVQDGTYKLPQMVKIK